MKTLPKTILTFCLWALWQTTAVAQVVQVDHSALSTILARHVNDKGWVDYAGLRRDHVALHAYLETLRTVDPAKLPSDAERLAFWINAYNAFTLNDVLEYVDGQTDSVKKVDGFFDKNKHIVGGRSLTLDEIERQGRDMRDPRIHFAINCASASCPRLRTSAYTAAELDRQLEQATTEFFGDSTRGLRLDLRSNAVFLSPILKWYAGDFNGATSRAGQLLSRARAAISGDNVIEFVVGHTKEDTAAYIRTKHPTVRYLDYDWTLNSQNLHQPGH